MRCRSSPPGWIGLPRPTSSRWSTPHRRRPNARAANLGPLMYGSNCPKGRGRSPRAISVASAKGIEQLVVCRPIGEIPPDVCPANRAIFADGENRGLGDAAVVLIPHTPFLDHTAFGITKHREAQQDLLDHHCVVVDRINRYSCQAHALGGESIAM